MGTFALRLQSILGLLRAKFFLLELFSGLLLPMTFFPHIVQKILDLLPFQYISYVPMLIYLGKLHGAGLARAIAIQVFWVAVLMAIGDGLWRWSTRKVIPNPPIAKEFWGNGMSEQGIDPQDTRLEGMGVASRLEQSRGGHLRLCRAKDEDTPNRVWKRGFANPLITMTFGCRSVQVITGSKRRLSP